MKNKIRNLSIIIILLLFVSFQISEIFSDPISDRGLEPEQVKLAAEKMRFNVLKAYQNQIHPSEIPESYWPSEIKALRPVFVYTKGFKSFIVLSRNEDREEGILVISYFSSSSETGGGFNKLKQLSRSVYWYKI